MRPQFAEVVGGPPWVTLGWALLLVAAFGVQLGTLSNFAQLELVYLGGNSADLVREGQLYRLVTGNLLHAGFQHLAINLIALLIVGAYVETLLGRARTQVIVIASALIGSLGSIALEAAPVSVGSSTIVFGLIGALAALVALRTRELRPGIWLPAACAVALALGDLVFPRADAVDRGAHLGGFVAGFGTTAILIAGRSLRGLNAEHVAGVRIAATAATLLFCTGLGFGIAQVAGSDRSRVVRWVELRMTASEADAVDVNNLAYLLALASEVERSTLEQARDAVLRELRTAPASAAMWDTLAVLHYRLGDLPAALTAARNALILDSSPPYAGRMARLEAEVLARGGNLTGRGERVPRVQLELATDQAQSPSLVVTLSERAAEGVTVHALVLREDTLVGLAELRLGAGSSLEQRFALESDYEDVRFAVALIDTRPTGLPDGSWRILELDASTAVLPPMLPPQDSVLGRSDPDHDSRGPAGAR